jgi:D-threo-aldose 1-dehydrogenase
MDRRQFGRSDLQISTIGLGCVPLGTVAKVATVEEAVDIMRATLEAGINFFDTAALYGEGESERRVGIALRELKDLLPGDFILNTKVGYRPNPFDYSEEQTLACVEESLRILGVERLPMIHIHDVQHSELSTVMNGSRKALHRLQEEGVVGLVGLAAGPIPMMMDYVNTGEFDCVLTHNRYTLLDQPAEELIARADELGMGIINGAPFSSGLLARPLDKSATYIYREADPETLARTATLNEICNRYDVSVKAAAIQLSTRDPRIHTTIMGASSAEQIRQSAEALGEVIPGEIWDEFRREVPPRLIDDIKGIHDK